MFQWLGLWIKVGGFSRKASVAVIFILKGTCWVCSSVCPLPAVCHGAQNKFFSSDQCQPPQLLSCYRATCFMSHCRAPLFHSMIIQSQTDLRITRTNKSFLEDVFWLRWLNMYSFLSWSCKPSNLCLSFWVRLRWLTQLRIIDKQNDSIAIEAISVAKKELISRILILDGRRYF